MEKEAIQNKEKNFVSCVLYLHNDGKNIREFLKTVCRAMEQNFEKYEIVCVNDCCMDDTIEEIHRYLEEKQYPPCGEPDQSELLSGGGNGHERRKRSGCWRFSL